MHTDPRSPAFLLLDDFADRIRDAWSAYRHWNGETAAAVRSAYMKEDYRRLASRAVEEAAGLGLFPEETLAGLHKLLCK